MNTRLLGLDLLRALLILEGIFYHSSVVISPVDWYYNSAEHSSYSIAMFFQVFHFFRMESFFFLAGFFATLVIQKKGVMYYLHDRKKRLLFPFIILFLLVVLPQNYFAGKIKGEYSFSIDLAHLWFLEVLILFISSHLLFMKLRGDLKYKILLPLSFLSIFLWDPFGHLISRFPEYNLFFYSLSKFMRFITFYILGCYVYFNKDKVLSLIERYKQILFFTSLIFTGILLYLVELNWSGQWATYSKLYVYPFKLLLQPLIFFINAFSITSLLFYYFLKLNSTNKFIDLIIMSSLVIYVLHHPLVIAFAFLIDRSGLDMSNTLYFLLVSLASFIVPLFIYLIFRRNYLFRLAFGIVK